MALPGLPPTRLAQASSRQHQVGSPFLYQPGAMSPPVEAKLAGRAHFFRVLLRFALVLYLDLFLQVTRFPALLTTGMQPY